MRYIKRNWFAAAGVAVFMVFVANAAFGQGAEKANKKWVLTAVEGNPVTATKAYIEIDEAKGRFAGHTGCNRMFGTFTSSDKVKFSQIGMTRMACMDGEINKVESAFVAALGKISEIRESGSSLELIDAGEVKLNFTLQSPSTGIGLDGKKWILDSIKGKDVSLSKELPFVNFDTAKGQLGGNSGCNVFGGELSITGNKFDAGKMISTMRACEEEGRMSIEHQMLDLLDRADSFEIKDDTLQFFVGKEIVLSFRGETK